MKQYNLILTTRNKKSLNKFINLFLKREALVLFKKQKHKSIKNTIKRFALLKSPHIYKKAQEQFELTFATKKILISSPFNFQLLILIKKIKSHLFNDINLKIVSLKKNKNKFKKSLINFNRLPLNYIPKYSNKKINILKYFYKIKRKNLNDIKKRLQVFDIFGEQN